MKLSVLLSVRMGLFSLIAVFLLMGGCSYNPAEHYIPDTPRVRMVVTQHLDDRGEPMSSSADVSIRQHALYAALWFYDVAPGEHVISCRLFASQGQIRDEQKFALIAHTGEPLHHFCAFSLNPYDAPGYWSIDVLIDDVTVVHRRLDVSD